MVDVLTTAPTLPLPDDHVLDKFGIGVSSSKRLPMASSEFKSEAR